MLTRLLHRRANYANFRIDNFLILFYFLYLLVSLFGYFFIELVSISIETYILYFLYIILLVIGTKIGLQLSPIEYPRLKFIKINWLIFLALCFSLIAIIYAWSIMIDKYGSITKIINSSYLIRIDLIGKNVSIFPMYLNYFLSLIYAFFCVSIAMYGISSKSKYLFSTLLFFIVIVLSDLTTFGRIGMVYTVFCFIGFLLIFKKNVFTPKLILLFSTLVGIVFLPRYIRGGGDTFTATVKTIIPNLKTSVGPVFYLFLVIFMYYFSSLFALGHYLENSHEYTWGARNFTPFFNIVTRIFGIGERKNIIDVTTQIPYDTNIYSIIKDMISDFGYIGLIVLPLIFGLILGYVFKNQGVFFKALKIYMFGWLFYTPLYNAFSFGGFFISFMFLLMLSLFFTPKEKYLKYI